MATLYELTEQASQLYELLQNEVIDEQIFADTLEGMGVEEKVESYCKIIKQLKADSDMYKAEADRVSAKKKQAENGAERMKKALLEFLVQSGQKKVKAGTFSVSKTSSQAVFISDESALPATYLINQPPKVDKAGIKKALKAGEEVNGAEIVTNESVRIS